MIRAYRIVKTRRASTAFDGEGARRAGGRWNSPGTRMVYLASSVALATLEVMVHLDDEGLRTAYSVIPLSFPAKCVLLPGKNGCAPLPKDWPLLPAPIECATWGDEWIESAASLVVRVPSVVVPTESNYLLNPAHPDWALVKIGQPQPFSLDARLIEKLASKSLEEE